MNRRAFLTRLAAFTAAIPFVGVFTPKRFISFAPGQDRLVVDDGGMELLDTKRIDVFDRYEYRYEWVTR